MTRLLAGAIAAAIAASPAGASIPRTFEISLVSDAELQDTVGTGGMETNFQFVLDEKASSDRDLFANASHDAMDGWWAYTGSVLIAASLRD